MRHKLCVVGFLFLVSIMMSSCESQDRKIESLIKQLELSSQSPADLLALGRIGQPAVPALIEALSDENSSVRQNVAMALAFIGKPAKEAVPALIEALSDESSRFRQRAVWALGRIGGSEALSPLVKALSDETTAVGIMAVWALKSVGEPAVPALIKALNHKDGVLRLRAAEALYQVDRSKLNTVLPVLIQALSDESIDVRRNAVMTLSKIGKPAVPALIQALSDESIDVRQSAARALYQLDRSKLNMVLPVLIQALSDESIDIRRDAVRTLSEIGKPAQAAVPTLIKALSDESKDVRMWATGALMEVGEPAVPALIQALSDEEVRQLVADILNSIGIPEPMKDVYEEKYKANAMLFAGVLTAFGLLHLLLFVFYPKSVGNLYYAILVSSVAVVIVIFGEVPLAVEMLGFLGVFIFGLRFLYSIFYIRLPKQFWIFVASWIIIGVIWSSIGDNESLRSSTNSICAEDEIVIFVPFLLFIVSSLGEMLRVLIAAIIKKRGGVWIISIGFMTFIFGFLAAIVADSVGFKHPTILLTVALLGLLVSMSIYLARNFAQTNRSLENANAELETQNIELVESRRRIQAAHTELQQTQTQLIQSEKMAGLGTMVAGVAHEINNPINFVYANMPILEGYISDLKELMGLYKAGDKSKEIEDFEQEIDLDFMLGDIDTLIDNSKEGAERVRQIVLDLRKFARQDAEEMQETDIHEGIESTLTIVHNRLKNRITVHKEFGEIPKIRGYPGQLNQVFMNLLTNAADAIEGEGDIWIKTWVDGDEVKISVRDNGCGIPDDTLPKIFDPFVTTKPVGSGTGLGLAVSHQIIEQHNGTIDVESEVGEGTTFVVTLPVESSVH